MPFHPATTRYAGSAALAVLLVAALGACGAGADGSEAPTSVTETAATRTVDTLRGEVEIPAEVQNVAVVDWQLPPALIDLGVTPAAIYDGYYEGDVAAARNVPERYVDALADVPRIGTMDTFSAEAVAAVDPDVILTLGVGLEDETVDRLETIAPVLYLDSTDGLTEIQRQVADALGVSEAFEQLLAEYEQTAAEIAAEYAEVIEATTWASVSAGTGTASWFSEGGATPTGALLNELGIEPSDVVDPEGFWGEGRSPETLADLASTDVVLYVATPDGEPIPGMVPILENELFQDLPAAEAENVFAWTHSSASCLGWATDALGELDEILGAVNLR